MIARILVILLLLSPSALLTADEEAAPPLFSATDDAGLKAAKGKIVRVRGKITRTGKAKATGANFLNFASGSFTVVTFGKSLKEFPDGEPADAYKNQCVEIRGEVTFYKDMPQIELSAPAQIKVIDEKAVAEASARKSDVAKADVAVEGVNSTAVPIEKTTEVDPRKYFSD
jgi:DNA/RNA endonuclease YhcR with UshA esterase domain